jgi:hypothetical membrane protein
VRRSELIGASVGLAGSVVMTVAAVVTALAYSGTAAEPYSPLNHWVSELGELGVSELAALFNVGLVVGGLSFAVFIATLAWQRRGMLAWLYGPIGIAAGIAGMFVGVFPMNQLDAHGIAALSFFNLGWICVGLASLDFWRRPERRFPRWLAWIGVLTVAAFIGFLIVLLPLIGEEGLGAPSVRPDVWIVPILEWLVIGGILGWTFATSLTWWRAVRGNND